LLYPANSDEMGVSLIFVVMESAKVFSRCRAWAARLHASEDQTWVFLA
jgi:hypothetical protein